jgi:SLBB domain
MFILALAAAVSQGHAQWKSEVDFRFQNGDSVGIGVFRTGKKPEVLMKKTVTLDSSGRATLDNGKDVKIGFGNIKAAMASVEERYRTGNDLIGFDVEAFILSHEGRGIVTVLGEVGTPGHGPWKDGMSLEDVVKSAGGFKKDAFLKRVVVQRESEFIYLDCRPENVAKEFKLKAGDFVYVPIAPLNF